MNANVSSLTGNALLTKPDPNTPAFFVTDRAAISIKAGTVLGDCVFAQDMPVVIDTALEPGTDYAIVVKDDNVSITRLLSAVPALAFGGFHFAPGGNAQARAGGDNNPGISPFSLWDINFRPACPNPRGMVYVAERRCWVDIYLTAANHLKNGTSWCGARIADGDDPPENPAGGRFEKFDYATAGAVMVHHGKSLLSVADFFAVAYGVTEKTACNDDPEVAGLDAARTSKFGLMQATGNLWQWGHDGDPDQPRASIFGGSWVDGDDAGSRCAVVAYSWPGDSNVVIGARGRSDHLQPV